MGEKVRYGCALTQQDLYLSFPRNRLKHKRQFSKFGSDIIIEEKFFVPVFTAIINDVIKNNVCCEIKLRGPRYLRFKIETISGDMFKRKRQYGGQLDIDIFKSNFTGYQFYIERETEAKRKVISRVNLGEKQRIKIINNINNGKFYIDEKPETTLDDYLSRLYYKYPELDRLDVKRIVMFGFHRLYTVLSKRCDFVFITSSVFTYIGCYFKRNVIDIYREIVHYREALKKKVRLLYRFKQLWYDWDGYYYYTLTDDEYEDAIDSNPNEKRLYKIGPKTLYKTIDECYIEGKGTRMFRIKKRKDEDKYKDLGFSWPYSIFEPMFKVRELDYVGPYNGSPKFKKLQVTGHDYEVLKRNRMTIHSINEYKSKMDRRRRRKLDSYLRTNIDWV